MKTLWTVVAWVFTGLLLIVYIRNFDVYSDKPEHTSQTNPQNLRSPDAPEALQQSFSSKRLEFNADFAMMLPYGVGMIVTKQTANALLTKNQRFVATVDDCARQIDQARWTSLYNERASSALLSTQRRDELNKKGIVSDERFPFIACFVQVAGALYVSYVRGGSVGGSNQCGDDDQECEWKRLLSETTDTGFSSAKVNAVQDISAEIESCEQSAASSDGMSTLMGQLAQAGGAAVKLCPVVPGVLPHVADVGNALEAVGITDHHGTYIGRHA
jgi:hypothetical protein